MTQRYIFRYNQEFCGHRKIRDMLISHDGSECIADTENLGVLDITDAVFDDGVEIPAYVFELEDIRKD